MMTVYGQQEKAVVICVTRTVITVMPRIGVVAVVVVAVLGVACSFLSGQWMEALSGFLWGSGGEDILRGIPLGADCKGNLGGAFSPEVRMLNTTILSLFDGTAATAVAASTPPLLLLVVLGEVFDVSDGARFYQRADPSSKLGVDPIGYNIFVGRDSSRAFASGDFTTPRDDVEGLKPAEIASIVEWRAFYRVHKTYRPVGRLAGRYYDCTGTPTQALRDVEATALASVNAQKAESAMLSQFRSCNSIYKPAERVSTISCSGGGFPRRLLWTVLAADASGPGVVGKTSEAGTSSETSMQRCVCLSGDEEAAIRSDKLHSSGSTLRVEEYADCESSVATVCRIKVS